MVLPLVTCCQDGGVNHVESVAAGATAADRREHYRTMLGDMVVEYLSAGKGP